MHLPWMMDWSQFGLLCLGKKLCGYRREIYSFRRIDSRIYRTVFIFVAYFCFDVERMAAEGIYKGLAWG
jgi:hypothetical protein